MRAKLRDPIVVDLEARALQIRVRQPKERHAERGVENLRTHPVHVLILDALDRIPAARARSGKAALLEVFFELLATAADSKPH